MFDNDISLDDRILSALLNHKECIVSAIEVDKLSEEYFDTVEHKKIYRNIMKIFKKTNGRTICTPEIIKIEAERARLLSVEVARLVSIYTRLQAINTPINEYPYYVNLLKERYYSRILRDSVARANVLCNKENDPVSAAQELLKTTSTIKMLSANDRVVRTTASESADTMKDQYIFAKTKQNEAMGLYTGFYKFHFKIYRNKFWCIRYIWRIFTGNTCLFNSFHINIVGSIHYNNSCNLHF
ncbi:MAG: hypothetical protein QW746_04260 [Thermoplasmata archaeon]